MRHTVAILGAGIGAEHLTGYLALPDRFHVKTICDLDEAKGAALAARSPGCEAVTDIAAVLADDDIDIVDICLPPHLHAPITLAAFAAAKHVICEKPLAGSIVDGDRMIAAAREHGRLLCPIFQYRYGRAHHVLGALIDTGLAGKPLVATLETHWNRGADYYAVPWRGTWAGERGGAVLGHAIHGHDLIARFFGPITAVSAMTDTRVNPIETEDCAAIAMCTESGGLVTSSVTLGAAGDTSRLRLVFEHLTAESGREPYAPGQGAWTYTARDADRQAALDRSVAEHASAFADRPQGFTGLLESVAEHLDDPGMPVVSALDALRSLELVAAIYLSNRTGRRVELPVDRAHPIARDWTP